MAAIKSYTEQLFTIASQYGYWLKPLAKLDGYFIWLLRTRPHLTHDDPRVLIIAGFHGEEIAGPWGALRWLKDSAASWIGKIDVSIIPIVNPYGFANNQRYGLSGIATNCGFCAPESPSIVNYPEILANYVQELSPEGQVLKDNINLIRSLSQNGYISLHEDKTSSEYYLYLYESSKKPSRLAKSMLGEMQKHFRFPYNGIAYVDSVPGNRTGPVCKDGLIFNFLDGSFDHYMLKSGVPTGVVVETPGKAQLKRRTAAMEAMVNRFLSSIRMAQ